MTNEELNEKICANLKADNVDLKEFSEEQQKQIILTYAAMIKIAN